MVISFLITSCESNQNDNSTMMEKTIMEVTTFSIHDTIDVTSFKEMDAKIENIFTSKQPGFIQRQSGVDEKGNYLVVVFWKSLNDADASMKKFMTESSVANYAAMINPSSMKMSRYHMEKAFDADQSQFVEIMSFDVKSEVNLKEFKKLNQKVETDFTGKRDGFMQRLTGFNEAGTQVVAVYWKNKSTSDASLKPFMEAPIAQDFLQAMNQSTMSMGRYELFP